MDASEALTQVEVHEPTAADVPELVSLEHTCFTGYYREHRLSASHFKAYLRNRRAIFLVALGAPSLVGYIAGYTKTVRPPGSARIESLAVSPRARRHGIGGLLVRRFIEDAKQRGCRSVTLEVALANEEVIRFFSNRGFKQCRYLRAYYSPRHDGIRMKLAMS